MAVALEKGGDGVTRGSGRHARASLVGRVLSQRWTILAVLGVGGTATVCEAVHRNGCRVAIKVLHAHFADHPVVRRRFLSEGYAANRVRHPDAVAVLDDGEEEDGTVFLVMELLEGQSLAERLTGRGRLPIAEVAAVAASVLEVLAAAHDRGVVHRDVKPANIFLTRAGRIKLLDFGLAMVAELATGSAITQNGMAVGTPAFMAPEQATGRSEDVNELTDIWAVGATMFQLLTRRLVHDSSSTNGAVVAAATLPAPAVRSVAADIPAAIAAVVDRALAFEPSARWPNARAMRGALLLAYPELVVRGVAEPSAPETEPEASCEGPRLRAPERHRSGQVLMALCGLIVLSLIGVLAWSPRAVASRRPQGTSKASNITSSGALTSAAAPQDVVQQRPPAVAQSGSAEPRAPSPLSFAVGAPRRPSPLAVVPPRVAAGALSSVRPPELPPTISDEALLDRRR